MINQIIKDWVGEEDVLYFEPEDPFESGRIQGRNNHIVLLKSRIPQLTERIEKELEVKISQLRQWLNEDRIDDPKKMVTNEDIKYWIKM